ncbi:MAG: Adaptive-response sensory-kinase SasA [Legionellaceae bacterium]
MLTQPKIVINEQNERFHTLAEYISHIVWTADPEGYLDYINSRWFDYSGQTFEEAQGTGWQKIMHQDDIPGYIQCLEKAHLQGEKYEMEIRYKNITDGLYRWHLSRGAPIRNEKGYIVKWVGTATDIDEQKRAQEEVTRLYEEVEQRVKERTVQLELANQELEAFSYSVSHDLHTPLRHIGSFIGLLAFHLAEQLDEKGNRYISIITESTKRMQSLVDDLLQFSRTAGLEIQKQSFNLNELINHICEDLVPECQNRHIDWNIEPLPLIYADKAMLYQVFSNLISNAIKFTRYQPQTQITINTYLANEEVIIMIKDNGVGFSMKYSDKLFSVFQRLHSQKEFEGTGIGLATAQRIIQRHGGRIWAEAEQNKGAIFYVALPHFESKIKED